MFYSIIRLVIFIILFLILSNYVKRSSIEKKKMVVILLLIVSMLVCTATYFLPLENIFVNFSSPESVYNYYGNGQIRDIVLGENSCMVFGSDTYRIFPKAKKGYKIPSLSSVKEVYSRYEMQKNFEVYNVSNTNDYYIWGSILQTKDEISATDSEGSQFKTILTKIPNTNYYRVLIYGYINNFSDEYRLNINGEEMLFIR